MARGESHKSEPRSGSLGVFAAFGVAVLGVLLLFAFTTRSCGREEAPAVGEPFAGAAEVFGQIRWRDCLGYEADPHAELTGRLGRRGYTPVGEARTVELPFDGEVESLASRCGVVAVVGAASTVLTGVAVGDRAERAPCSPPIAAIGICAEGPIHLRGTGRVTLQAYRFRGLEPTDATRSGVPPELWLAHAEAERLFAARGYRPGPRALRVEVAAGDVSFEPPSPTRGCVLWVVAGTGVGSAQSRWEAETLAHDLAPSTLLAAVATCEGTGRGELRFTDSGSDGGTLLALPYVAAEGPTVPGEAPGRSRLADIDVTDDPAELTLP